MKGYFFFKKYERSRYVNLENIPEYLQENANWCLWKYETRNNKKTKILINPITEVCASNRKQKGKCTSHQIKNSQVEEILLREIRKVTVFAKYHEQEFVDLVLKKKTSELNQVLRNQKKELEDSKDRIAKLDSIVQNLYEDNLEGKISDQRFEKMAKAYDEEEILLQKRIAELEETITKSQEEELNVESFLKLVRKYKDIKELDPEIIRTFVDKIYVEQSEKVPDTN